MEKNCHVCARPICVLATTCDVCTKFCCYECLLVHQCKIPHCRRNGRLMCKTCDSIESKIDVINNKL